MAATPHGNWLPFPDLAGAAPAHVAVQDADSAGSELSKHIADALRRGLVAKYFATLDADGELGVDLRVVCRDAKRQNMRVEYLIIAIKDAWRALPEAKTLPQGSQGTEVLNRVITLCIAEFYSAERAD